MAQCSARVRGVKRFGLALAVLAALVCHPTETPAQTTDMGPIIKFMNSFKDLLNSEAYRNAVEERAREQLTALPTPCPTAELKRDLRISQYEQFRFNEIDDEGRLVGGMWGQPFDVKDCGDLTRVNVLVVGNPEQGMQTSLYVPGVATGHPKILVALMAEVAKATVERTPQCDKRSIINTTYRGSDADLVKDPKNKRPFTQIWTVWACDAVLDVPVHFTPGPKGIDARVIPTEVAQH
jgi:hypothetical protein